MKIDLTKIWHDRSGICARLDRVAGFFAVWRKRRLRRAARDSSRAWLSITQRTGKPDLQSDGAWSTPRGRSTTSTGADRRKSIFAERT